MASSAPPSEFFPGIDFNISFYTEGDSSVTLNYVNSNFLKCVGYAYSRAISTSFNGVIYALDGINTTNITATGTITATLFSGSGASLTDLDATKITTGTINNDRITLTAAKIPDLDAAKITTGTINNDRITLTAAKIPDLDAAKITTGTINNDRITLTATKIPSLDAAKITTGTINNDRITLTAAKIPDLDAAKIATGTISNDRIALTTTKVFQHFNTTNFAIVDDKIDFPATYSINITGYDSPTLYTPNDPRRLKGKMNVSYDDRQGLYKLEATNITKTDNVAVLRYKVGDKISIRNTAECAKDFYLYDGFKYYMSVLLVKRPDNRPLDHYVDDAYGTLLFEWKSSDGLEGRVPAYVMDYRQNPDKSYPFTTIMSFVVEAGFNYYLYKLWAQTEVSAGGTIYVKLSGYGDENDDFNRTYGAGQTFKLRSDYVFTVNDYTPRTYTAALPGLALQNTPGTVKPRRGMALDDEGGLSAVPISSDLITNMNTNHFTNNIGTGKIDINSAYVAPSATKLATTRSIAGVNFDGSGAIDIPYANLTSKPSLFSGSYSDLTNKPSLFSGSYTDLSNKPTLFSGSYTDLTNKPTIPAAQVNSDWTATTGISVINNKPTLFSGSYTDLTNKPTIPAAQVQTDWNATTGLGVLTNKPTIPAAQVQTDWNATTGLGALLNKPPLFSGAYSALTGVPTTWTDTQIPTLAITKISGLQGALDAKQATLTTTQLSAFMNTTDHFTLNSTNNKIDFKTTYKVPTSGTADTLANSRNIAGVAFNGSSSIDIPYVNLSSIPTTWTTTQIPTLAISKISGLQGALDAKQATLTSTTLDITTTIIPPNQPTTINIPTTYKPTTAGTADTLTNSRNIAGVDFNGSINIDIPYANLTNKLSQGTGISISAANPPVISATYASVNLISIFNSIQFSNVNNLIQINSSYKPNAVNADTATKLATGKYISGVLFDGSSDVNLSYFGLTNRPWDVYPGQSTYLYFNQSGNVGIGVLTTAEEKLHVVGNIKASQNLIAGMNLTVAGTSAITGTSTLTGRVGIGKAPHATYDCDVNGTLNATSVLVGGTAITGSKWTNNSVDATKIYYNGGNVGIGTTNPTALLDLVKPTAAAVATDIINMRFNADWGLKLQQNYTANGNIQYDFIHRYNAVNYNALTFKGANLGIGTTIPSYKLHHKCSYDNVGTGLHLDADDGSNNANKYALTIWPFVVGGGQVGWRFRTQSLDGGNNTPLEFRHNGDIRFQADRWHGSSDGGLRIYYATNGTTYFRSGNALGEQFAWRSSLDNTFAYFNNNVLYAYMYNLSDRRIKRDIEDINDETALNMLLLVQPTTYYYKDETRNKGNGKVYGFIAQQIKEVIPDAVSITKEIIPNIYNTCLVYNKREIYHSIPQDVAIDTEVHILDKEIGEKGKRYKIKEIYEDHFVIDEDIDGDDCFVFGYEVNDLHAIDKSYIYTLNVCATQELHRRIEAQNVIIKSQEERIKELEIKIEKLYLAIINNN